jgi:hypothetical protein
VGDRAPRRRLHVAGRLRPRGLSPTPGRARATRSARHPAKNSCPAACEYRFPGESGYLPRVEGESVSFPDAGEGAVYIRVAGAADGDTETGRGAIVFFQPSSPAYFDEFRPSRSGFYFDNAAAVPATGTASTKYAYAQAYGQAEVEALVADATAQPTPDAPPPPSPPAVQAATPPAATRPAANFRIRRVHHFKSAGTLKMLIGVTGPGKLSLTGKRVSAVSRRVTTPGTLFLTVGPNPELRQRPGETTRKAKRLPAWRLKLVSASPPASTARE